VACLAFSCVAWPLSFRRSCQRSFEFAALRKSSRSPAFAGRHLVTHDRLVLFFHVPPGSTSRSSALTLLYYWARHTSHSDDHSQGSCEQECLTSPVGSCRLSSTSTILWVAFALHLRYAEPKLPVSSRFVRPPPANCRLPLATNLGLLHRHRTPFERRSTALDFP